MSPSGDGMINPGTARAINSGRAAAGSALRTLQKHLQKVFIVFVIGMIGTIYAMRLVVWPNLREIITSRTNEITSGKVELIATTPFDVILMQVKIGLIMGVIVSIPVLLYLGRDAIRDQHWYPEGRVPLWKVVPVAVLAIGLFLGGLTYGYYLFFPFMFEFLAENAVGAGILPRYGIVEFTEFVMVLLLSFGLAAELPLAMSGLAYAGIVRYETFRDKWRYAVVLIFVFGAVFSPPDPFTQVMWALPLLALYGASLYLTKMVVATKRGAEEGGFRETLAEKGGPLAGIALVAAAAVYAFFVYGGLAFVNAQIVPNIPLVDLSPTLRWTPLGPIVAYGVPRDIAVIGVSAGIGLLAFLAAFLSFVFASLDAGPVDDGTMGDPTAIDFETLDESGVRAAPIQAFMELEESEALDHASTAMENDDPDKAQAILDRFDEAESARQAEEAAEAAAAPAPDEGTEEPTSAQSEESGNVIQSTAAGMANAFTEDETTEDDIGGYYYDLTFILQSLASKMFRIVGLFMIVLAGSFFWLQQGGLGDIRVDFLARIPDAVLSEQSLNLVALHPVEALIFEVKVSTILAVVVTLPLVLYYAWPAVQDRGFVSRTGDRRTFFAWGIALILGLIGGTYVGYAFVAPEIISYLVYDQIRADMLIGYRLKNFFWLVILTTAGVGLLFDVPITMLLFQAGGLVSYRTFRKRWRVITIGVFAIAGIATPDSLYTMFIVAIPVMLFYAIGLALLWVVTLGGRRGGGSRPVEPEPTSD